MGKGCAKDSSTGSDSLKSKCGCAGGDQRPTVHVLTPPATDAYVHLIFVFIIRVSNPGLDNVHDVANCRFRLNPSEGQLGYSRGVSRWSSLVFTSPDKNFHPLMRCVKYVTMTVRLTVFVIN